MMFVAVKSRMGVDQSHVFYLFECNNRSPHLSQLSKSPVAILAGKAGTLFAISVTVEGLVL